MVRGVRVSVAVRTGVDVGVGLEVADGLAVGLGVAVGQSIGMVGGGNGVSIGRIVGVAMIDKGGSKRVAHQLGCSRPVSSRLLLSIPGTFCIHQVTKPD